MTKKKKRKKEKEQKNGGIHTYGQSRNTSVKKKYRVQELGLHQ